MVGTAKGKRREEERIEEIKKTGKSSEKIKKGWDWKKGGGGKLGGGQERKKERGMEERKCRVRK
jgi:hypothetical protein